MRLLLVGGAALAGLAVCSTPAPAAPVPIANHSFESPSVGGSFAVVAPDNWVAVAAPDTFIEDNAAVGFSGGDGAQYVGLDNDGGYIYQSLGVPFAPLFKYTIDLASAHRAGFGHGVVQFGLFSSDAIGTDVGTPGFMDVQGVWTGSGNPSADDQFNQLRDASVLHTIGTGSLGNVYSHTTGLVPPTGNLVVFIRDASGGRVNVDNIRLDATLIPEPASALLAAGFGLALVAAGRRR